MPKLLIASHWYVPSSEDLGEMNKMLPLEELSLKTSTPLMIKGRPFLVQEYLISESNNDSALHPKTKGSPKSKKKHMHRT